MFDSDTVQTAVSEMLRDPHGYGASLLASEFITSLRRILSFFSMIFLVGIVMLIPKYNEAERRRRESLLPKASAHARISFHPEQWDIVLTHIESGNPSEWRVAIMEADKILADVVEGMGYVGASLGEVLKSMDEGDLKSINQAWEAHRARNRIAHEGLQYILTEREARRVIGLYQQVFQELGYL